MKKKIVKICGMRDEANISAIATLPVDYLGFIFFEKSPRFVSDTINITFPQKRVGVFVNADMNFLVSKVIDYQLDIAQLHGKETPQYIAVLKEKMPNLGIWKAVSVDENTDFEAIKMYESLVSCFVFDTKTPHYGGAGTKFDWQILAKYGGNTPFLLAGGIGADDEAAVKNVFEKYALCEGIDLNSKFEISPALKNADILRGFISELKNQFIMG